MKKRFRSILAVVVLVLLILATIMRLTPDGKIVYRVKKIDLYGKQKHIYLKAKYSGGANDHSITILSGNNDAIPFNADSNHNYVYNGLGAIFYRGHTDTLWLYVHRKSPTPRQFRKDIMVIQVELDNLQMMHLKDTHYYQNKRVAEF